MDWGVFQVIRYSVSSINLAWEGAKVQGIRRGAKHKTAPDSLRPTSQRDNAIAYRRYDGR